MSALQQKSFLTISVKNDSTIIIKKKIDFNFPLDKFHPLINYGIIKI
jgi:hypothetical protein